MAGDSPEAASIKIVARAHQDLIWARVRHTNQLRNALREYYPAALETFDDLAHRDTLAILGKAPTPALGARLTLPQIRAALKRGGRQRNIDVVARRIQAGLRTSHLTAPGPVADAYGTIVASLVKIVVETNRQIDDLEATLGTRFRKHPDADIYLSMPGLGAVLGARALGEFGDDPRPLHQRPSLAGTRPARRPSPWHQAANTPWSPDTYATSVSTTPLDQWAFTSLQNSPGARAFYDQRKAAGDKHHQALRALANRFVGILHGCLKHRTPYDEHTAWAHRTALDRAAA